MRRGFHWVVLVCCMACPAFVAHAAPPAPITIASEAARVPAWHGLRVIKSADRELSPQQAAELAAGSDVLAVDGPAHILGRGTSPYWALFSLSNPEASEQLRMLALELTTQSDIRLFERDSAGAWRPVASLADAAAGRIGGGTIHPVWALHLEPRRTTDLLMRVEGPAIIRFPLFVYQPLRYIEQERKVHIAIGVALASCLFIGVYIGSLRRYLNDRSMPLFVCMLIADLMGALWLSGFLSEAFPALPESTLSAIGFSAYAILFGCGSLHARIYLDLAAWAPTADRLLLVLGWVWLALPPWFPMVFPVAARILLMLYGTAIALFLVAIAIRAARRGIPLSGFVAAAWVTYLFAGASFLLARAVTNIKTEPSSTLILIQATVVAILFGFAMSQRILRQRDALVAARQEAITQHEKVTALMRERSMLFAATNHDLRQPLLGVGLFANMLKSACTQVEREGRARKLRVALAEVDDILIGIQQLAAVNEGEQVPVFETVRLDDVLAPLIDEYRVRAEYKSLAIRYVPSRLSITTHVPYFQRIVRNVLSNAIRYTDREARILIGCRRGGGLRLVIIDSGRGMTEEQTRRAFDAFQRFDAQMSIPDGFGLGLFSTKSLANTLGLAVALRSHPGRGTEFSLGIS